MILYVYTHLYTVGKQLVKKFPPRMFPDIHVICIIYRKDPSSTENTIPLGHQMSYSPSINEYMYIKIIYIQVICIIYRKGSSSPERIPLGHQMALSQSINEYI